MRLFVCVCNFLALYQTGNCTKTKVCLHTVCAEITFITEVSISLVKHKKVDGSVDVLLGLLDFYLLLKMAYSR
jgi:hypothetical protein